MKHCDRCGSNNSNEYDFCVNCGQPLGPEPYIMIQGQGKTTKGFISDFFYLIYCGGVLILSAIIMGILIIMFGFWIELLIYIIWAIILLGCLSQVIVALIDWISEKLELKKKRKGLDHESQS